MKETIRVSDYAGLITEMLPKGILLNTMADKFDSMVIGWGHLGTIWGRQTFVAYVRQSRFTKEQLDRTGEFTVSVPLDGVCPKIGKVCGSMSGRDTDKVAEAGITLEEPRTNRTPGIREYPLTLECKVLYRQDQDPALFPEDIRERFFPVAKESSNPVVSRDVHTVYIGEIVDAYIIKED